MLSFDDARTLFHEFGHALHALLSDVTYPMISGTGVLTDFVELPSQLYEHWLEQPEILREFARHYKTGAPMPGAMIERLIAARTFNQGFTTVEYIASALVDLEFHSLPSAAKPRRRCLRDECAEQDRHAGRNRDASPPAAFRACVLGRRLRLGLLQLHVVGSARRRCVPGLPGDRRRVRPGHGAASCATISMRRAARATRPRPTRRSAAGCRPPTRCCASAGLGRRRRKNESVSAASASWPGLSRPSTPSLRFYAVKTWMPAQASLRSLRKLGCERGHDGV